MVKLTERLRNTFFVNPSEEFERPGSAPAGAPCSLPCAGEGN